VEVDVAAGGGAEECGGVGIGGNEGRGVDISDIIMFFSGIMAHRRQRRLI
jgi:hypothetical protein